MGQWRKENSLPSIEGKKHSLRKLLFVLLLSLIIGTHIFWDASTLFSSDDLWGMLQGLGPSAPLCYIALMSLAVVIRPIPSLPLDIAAGAFFGPYLGTFYSVLGALIGSAISFSVSRVLGRNLIERFLRGHINFCTSCSDRFLTKIVFFSRLLPFFSFDIVSYGAGLTKISLRNFLLATFFGMIPLTFLYNVFGAVLVPGNNVTVIPGS